MTDDIQGLSANRLLTIYLMASYLYYERHISAIPDTCFDGVCKQLLFRFKEVDHQHGYLLDKDALRAGTGYHIRETDYPIMVKQAAHHWYDHGAPIVQNVLRRRRRRIEPNRVEAPNTNAAFKSTRRRRSV